MVPNQHHHFNVEGIKGIVTQSQRLSLEDSKELVQSIDKPVPENPGPNLNNGKTELTMSIGVAYANCKRNREKIFGEFWGVLMD